ncbi:hypothetical protein EXIGLDRAFT_708224 [Exidia glandulosa HHB12029]|uniref:Uncharacterized protein n=1 Tax=Exidia glandulosa HHB12029 TaxID=1314781 RepID=A0A165Z2R6_EXIGL|nr:hypothetical protein EXIGLDRAFT_708224 [Exidia glandulosa HHB12029]
MWNPDTSLITSREDWRKEMARWRASIQELDQDSDVDFEEDAPAGRKRSLLPCTLERLFGDAPKNPPRPKRTYTEEEHYMELMADELADPEPAKDDGALEGSGDEYEE